MSRRAVQVGEILDLGCAAASSDRNMGSMGMVSGTTASMAGSWERAVAWLLRMGADIDLGGENYRTDGS